MVHTSVLKNVFGENPKASLRVGCIKNSSGCK